MRKRLVIGAIAAVVIGVTTYLLSQPRQGTVEWHLRELREVNGPFDVWINRFAPRGIANMNARRWQKKWQFHKNALIKLGYLETRWFVLSNREPDAVAEALWTAAPQHPHVSWDFGGPFGGATNNVGVTAPPAEMTRWEKLIREADVPEAK